MIECANHQGRAAFGVCAKCGKPFCAECLTMTSAGRILCLPCLAAEKTKAEQPAAAVETRCEAEAPAAVNSACRGGNKA
nr:MAG TPA: dehydrogenase accessory protein [Caudoviricetes sp.]